MIQKLHKLILYLTISGKALIISFFRPYFLQNLINIEEFLDIHQDGNLSLIVPQLLQIRILVNQLSQ